MAGCASCGRELPGEFPYRHFCGAARGVRAGWAEQRKIVSLLLASVGPLAECGTRGHAWAHRFR